jgi:hypothetical protein
MRESKIGGQSREPATLPSDRTNVVPYPLYPFIERMLIRTREANGRFLDKSQQEFS